MDLLESTDEKVRFGNKIYYEGKLTEARFKTSTHMYVRIDARRRGGKEGVHRVCVTLRLSCGR